MWIDLTFLLQVKDSFAIKRLSEEEKEKNRQKDDNELQGIGKSVKNLNLKTQIIVMKNLI